MKSGQLIEFNMRNIFLKKNIHRMWRGEINSRHFLEKLELSTTLDQ